MILSTQKILCRQQLPTKSALAESARAGHKSFRTGRKRVQAGHKSFRTGRKRVGQGVKVFERAESTPGRALRFSNGLKTCWAVNKSFRTCKKRARQDIKFFARTKKMPEIKIQGVSGALRRPAVAQFACALSPRRAMARLRSLSAHCKNNPPPLLHSLTQKKREKKAVHS